MEPSFGEGATGRSAEAARSRGLLESIDALEKDGDSDLAAWARCDWLLEALASSLGAFGADPKDRSRSS
jgi:hypothetical protein